MIRVCVYGARVRRQWNIIMVRKVCGDNLFLVEVCVWKWSSCERSVFTECS